MFDKQEYMEPCHSANRQIRQIITLIFKQIITQVILLIISQILRPIIILINGQYIRWIIRLIIRHILDR